MGTATPKSAHKIPGFPKNEFMMAKNTKSQSFDRDFEQILLNN